MRKHLYVAFAGLLISLRCYSATTPNMLLDKPVIGQPGYAQKIDLILNQIDSHDHTSGKGVLIPSAGIQDGAITTNKIQALSVTGAKLSAGIVDNSTIELSSSVLRVKDAGITSSKIADGNVTQAKLSAVTTGTTVGVGNLAVSASSGVYTITSSFAQITNFSITLTTSGRPVRLWMENGDSSQIGRVSLTYGATDAGAEIYGDIQFKSNGTIVSVERFGWGDGSGDIQRPSIQVPCSSFDKTITLAAGTYTFTAEARYVSTPSGGTGAVNYCRFLAKEL